MFQKISLLTAASVAFLAYGQTPANPPAQQQPQQSDDSRQRDSSRTTDTNRGENRRGNYGSLNAKDGQFLREAIHDNHHEVMLGRMGVEKASDSAVKTFSQKMVDDHSKAAADLEALAQQKGMDVAKMGMGKMGMGKMDGKMDKDHAGQAKPGEPSADRPQQSAAYDKPDKGPAARLMNLSGAQFDREFMTQMVKAHEKDVSHFERASKNATDPEVKQLAAKLLPTLREHLTEAKSIHSKLGGTSSSADTRR